MNQQIYHPIRLVLAGALGFALLLVACGKSGDDTPDPTGKTTSSFDLLQTRILTPTCATSGCHSSQQDPTFAQHKLVLTADVAYQNLVGVASTNSG